MDDKGPCALTGHMVQNPPCWMAKDAASSTGTSKTKENRGSQVGIPLCSNLLHSFAIQYGGFCTM